MFSKNKTSLLTSLPSAVLLNTVLSHNTANELAKLAQVSKELSGITKSSEKLISNIMNMGFDILAYRANLGLRIAQHGANISMEIKNYFITGSDLISSLGYRRLCWLSDEEIATQVKASKVRASWRNPGYSEKISAFHEHNVFVLNQPATEIYLINTGKFKPAGFPIHLSKEDLSALETQQCDHNGELLETDENKSLIERIKKEACKATASLSILPLEEKLRQLTILLVGTLICALAYEDYKYGEQKAFDSKLLYPFSQSHAEEINLFEKISIEEKIQRVGLSALQGRLPFHQQMLNPKIFAGELLSEDSSLGLNTIGQLQALFDHFKIPSGIDLSKEEVKEAPKNKP